MIRSFLGLPLPDAATRGLEALQTGLPIARPVSAENMHLTLAFLDDQPEHVLRDLAEAMLDLRSAPIELHLSGLTILGGKQPGAIAVHADGGERLTRLHVRVERMVRASGIALQRRKFRPHVTIFRLGKRVEETEQLRLQTWIANSARFDPIDCRADTLAMYESVLDRSGARYHVLADVDLREN